MNRYTHYIGLFLIGMIALSSCQPVSSKRNSALKPKGAAPSVAQKAPSQGAPTQEDEHTPQQTFNVDSTSQVPSKRKIPTLREQLEKVQQQQDQTFTKLDEVQKEVLSLKQSVEDMRANISMQSAAPKKSTKPIAGEPKESAPEQLLQEEKPSASAKKSTTFPDFPKQQGKKPVSREILPDNVAENSDEEVVEAPKKITKPKTVKKKVATAKPKQQVVEEDVLPEERSIASSDKSKIAKSAPVKETSKEKESPKPTTVSAEKNPVQDDYTKALDLFSKKKFSEAATLLSAYSNTTKNATQQANAVYWMGESYYGMGKYDEAIKNFEKVISLKSATKSDDALAMIGESHVKRGINAEAKKAYEKLIAEYPKSEFVPRAKKMLQKL